MLTQTLTCLLMHMFSQVDGGASFC